MATISQDAPLADCQYVESHTAATDLAVGDVIVLGDDTVGIVGPRAIDTGDTGPVVLASPKCVATKKVPSSVIAGGDLLYVATTGADIGTVALATDSFVATTVSYRCAVAINPSSATDTTVEFAFGMGTPAIDNDQVTTS